MQRVSRSGWNIKPVTGSALEDRYLSVLAKASDEEGWQIVDKIAPYVADPNMVKVLRGHRCGGVFIAMCLMREIEDKEAAMRAVFEP